MSSVIERTNHPQSRPILSLVVAMAGEQVAIERRCRVALAAATPAKT